MGGHDETALCWACCADFIAAAGLMLSCQDDLARRPRPCLNGLAWMALALWSCQHNLALSNKPGGGGEGGCVHLFPPQWRTTHWRMRHCRIMAPMRPQSIHNAKADCQQQASLTGWKSALKGCKAISWMTHRGWASLKSSVSTLLTSWEGPLHQ